MSPHCRFDRAGKLKAFASAFKKRAWLIEWVDSAKPPGRTATAYAINDIDSGQAL